MKAFDSFSIIFSKFVLTTPLDNGNFKLYGKKRKALTEMCKRLVTGSAKYSNEMPLVQQLNPSKWKPITPTDQFQEKQKPVVIAFGAARFGNLRGNVPAPTKAFKQALMDFIKAPPPQVQRQDLYGPRYLVMVDEYLTSQICPICQTRTTQKTLDNDNY